ARARPRRRARPEGLTAPSFQRSRSSVSPLSRRAGRGAGDAARPPQPRVEDSTFGLRCEGVCSACKRCWRGTRPKKWTGAVGGLWPRLSAERWATVHEPSLTRHVAFVRSVDGGQVPQLDGPILAARGQGLAVRAERYGHDVVGMFLQGGRLLAAF